MRTLRDAVLDVLTASLGGGPQSLTRDEIAAALSRPPDAARGDLAFPTFPLAKIAKQAPPKIAAELALEIRNQIREGHAKGELALIKDVQAAGPYLNFFAAPGGLLAETLDALASGGFDESIKADTSARTMIEFSQPNTHKVFHVGHLRNVAVGDCLQRVLRARGHDVVAANYYGDFGIDVAKCLWWLLNKDVGDAPETGRGVWLGKAYANTTSHLAELEKNDKDQLTVVHKEIRSILDGIKSDDAKLVELYQSTRQWCLDEFAEIYDWLVVHFDTDFFESELEEAGQAIVDEYIERGIFEPSQGAIICDLEDYKLGPALVRKTDGTSLYLTWDLVLARRKFDEFKVERSLYVVGAEQTYHFKQLFATLERMGYERAKDCHHVAYELVMLPEGKMSSRKGKVVTFDEVRTDIVAAIDERMRNDERGDRSSWGEDQWRETIDRVAVACLRYGMLRSSNTTRVIFDAETWSSLEGETGVYLLYSMARIAGIFRRGGEPGTDTLADAARGCAEFGEEAERALLNHLLRYGEILAQVERTTDPSHLSSWVYEGSKLFSRFYHDCPVLKAGEPLRSARLGLIHTTREVLGRGMNALGILAVDEM